MFDRLSDAFDRQDYRTATQLLKELLQQAPDNPWLKLYLGRLREETGRLDDADTIYRALLRETPNPKLAMQARQGLQRLYERKQAQRQAARAQATALPNSQEPGFLALEKIDGAARSSAIAQFARILNLDAYTARLLLPSRGWRLYRTGAIGELQQLGQELGDAGVRCAWGSLSELQAIRVFDVHYFQAIAPQAIAVCENEQKQLGQIPFQWSEVSQRVEGMLPIFEQVLDLGYRDRLIRKEKTQDYQYICDLHLPNRRCILRLHDSIYRFDQGIAVLESETIDSSTIRIHWNQLLDHLNHQLPQAPVWSEFTAFGETAADFAGPLGRLTSHIQILRQTDSFWDPAFELYSRLIFLREKHR